MPSLLRSIADHLTPSANNTTRLHPRPDAFSTANAIDALFPRTTPEMDGEECLHDCESCTVHYPKKFSINEEDTLYGHIAAFSTHLLVATGKTDWVRDVEDEQGSVMCAVGKHRSEVAGGKLMLSASNIPVPRDEGEEEGPYGEDRATTVLLLPAFKVVDNVTPKHVPDLIQSVINTAPTTTTPLPTATKAEAPAPAPATNGASDSRISTPAPSTLPAGLRLRPCPHKYLILMCSQATRDARCGQTAPLLRRELERHLRPLGLYRDMHDARPGGVGIYFISHVGGHKYSANMMVYRRAEGRKSGNGEAEAEAAQCIWLARVRPEDCENIVRFTVLQGKVVKPERQLRGGFDREKGLVSW